MARITGFTQDQDMTDGIGTFHFDNGRTLYAHDLQTAAPFLQRQAQPSEAIVDDIQPGPDNRVAGLGGGPAGQDLNTQNLAVDTQGPAQEPPSATDAPAPGVGTSSAPYVSGPYLPSTPTVRATTPPPQQATLVPPPADMLAPAPGSPSNDAEQQAVLAGAPKATGPTKARIVPKSQSEKVETEGLPYSEEDARIRADLSINSNMAKLAIAKTESDRAIAQAAHAQALIPGLQKQAAAAQTEVGRQDTQYKQDQADLAHMQQTENNPNRWIQSKGTLGAIGIALAQGMGAWASIRTGTENHVAKQIQGYIDRDIAAQENDKNSKLQQLKMHYGDMDQAKAALKIAQTNLSDQVAIQMAAGQKSTDVQNQLQDFLATNAITRNAEEDKFKSASYGKRTVSGEATITPASAGGGPNLVARFKYFKSLGEDDATARHHAALGTPTGAAGNQPDAIDRPNVATIHGKSYEFDSPEAAKDAHETASTSVMLQSKLDEMDRILSNGVESHAEQAKLVALGEETAAMFPKLLLNAKRPNPDLTEKAQHALGDWGTDYMSWTAHDYLGRHRAAIATMRESVKQIHDDAKEGGKEVKPGLYKNEKGQSYRGYKFVTPASRLEKVE